VSSYDGPRDRYRSIRLLDGSQYRELCLRMEEETLFPGTSVAVDPARDIRDGGQAGVDQRNSHLWDPLRLTRGCADCGCHGSGSWPWLVLRTVASLP
jgi:hypothetical protein